eukprot:397230_1
MNKFNNLQDPACDPAHDPAHWIGTNTALERLSNGSRLDQAFTNEDDWYLYWTLSGGIRIGEPSAHDQWCFWESGVLTGTILQYFMGMLKQLNRQQSRQLVRQQSRQLVRQQSRQLVRQ